MPWAYTSPQEFDVKAALLRRFRGNFDLGQDFVFGIFAPDETRVLGGTGLHTRAGRRRVSRSATGFAPTQCGRGLRPRSPGR